MIQNTRVEDDGKIIAIHVPMKFKRRGGRKEIILPPGFEERESKPITVFIPSSVIILTIEPTPSYL